ncbi:CDP-alcohol phosphatidyltransferase family protein [Halobacterium salinarum]|uniref:CDP-alcohol 1-archaetidyltransferase n=3 Tax=Halobacterium salinarum TaxID=2242 RepID=Q9HQT0_HALSA|nr:CDP-alcohol phosphatidyltransferase family protein [Halobacterium salinarum]AAG19433.1 conserved hypothetical protein [Halobacterium salinarum NRC-1]MBB6090117.1 CDP-diacylglycerol--glycerol-3-phosphate 3-phosphatidyltransferase [Halobacterium salinarum]MDL0131553.1 CDP-alcohol phosphatidyltransferase family protein [Halobacterium salinarum]UEB92857.1 CDP-alcohol phosphatidyltransferase family protein [Halobacterium salinarum NRC-34001]CAP13709.1 CDP-alcohol 1-archaetidyltransferase [Haloba
MTRVPRALRAQYWLLVAGFAVSGVGTAWGLSAALGHAGALRWVVAAAVPLAYVVGFLGRHLDANHRPSGVASADGGRPVRGTVGVANAVTATRGWLYAAVFGFVAVSPPVGSWWRWLPAAWYGSGVVLDTVDGALARRVGRRTVLGARLDLATDTLGFLCAPLVAVAWGRLPVWYLSLSLARYVFKLACWVRRRRGRHVGDLPPSRSRRLLAGMQMLFITVALVPVLPAAVVTPIAGIVLVPSLVVFGRDYCAVAGYFGVRDEGDAVEDTSETGGNAEGGSLR